MAKTIMISNDLYKELKDEKKDRSFSKTIKDFIEISKWKMGADLKKHVGILKDDKEYDKIMKELKPLYRKWTKRYA